MTEEPSIPAGLKVERTASGAWRFALPRERGWWGAIFPGIPVAMVFGGFTAYWIWMWWHQSKHNTQRLVGMIFVLPFVAAVIFMFRGIWLTLFGRNSLEVDAEAVSICRSTPLFETRRRLRLTEVLSVTADVQRGKSLRTDYLAIKTAKKEHRVAEGLDRESIEWLGARISALADAARTEGGPGAPGLLAVFERDLRSDRFEEGKVRAEDVRELQAEAGPPPTGSGIEVLEERGDCLRLRVAAGSGGPLIFFGTVWTIFTGGILLGVWLAGARSPETPAWTLPLVGIPFVGVGLLVLGLGLRMKTMVEELEFRPGEVIRSARSIFGARTERLAGTGLTLRREESYRQNEVPVYRLCIADATGRHIRFAGGMRADAQLWLSARAGAILGSLALDLPGEPVLPALEPGSPPPEGAGIMVLGDAIEVFDAQLTARGGSGALSFVIFCLGITALVGIVMLCFKLQIFGPAEGPQWRSFLWLLPSTALGGWVFAYAVRQQTLTEEVSVRPGRAEWSAVSIFGRSSRRLEGRVAISREISYQAGSTVYYNLILRDESGRKIKFGTNLRPDAQLWMMARITAALGQGVPAGNA
ncbi:MAG TPA: hypothetical protein PK280_13180 [Planctomycetota bacterium]|nr:hypothetical protein [Planctomycetota bacterium]